MDTITTTKSLLMLNGSVRPAMVSLMQSDYHLIAAAPELYEACKTVLAVWDTCAGHTEEGRALDMMEDAIKKAEGKL
jgi:hypothetical protein